MRERGGEREREREREGEREGEREREQLIQFSVRDFTPVFGRKR